MKIYTIGMLVLAAAGFWAAFAHSGEPTKESPFKLAIVGIESGKLYALCAPVVTPTPPADSEDH
jgi:hypothetical protein